MTVHALPVLGSLQAQPAQILKTASFPGVLFPWQPQAAEEEEEEQEQDVEEPGSPGRKRRSRAASGDGDGDDGDASRPRKRRVDAASFPAVANATGKRGTKVRGALCCLASPVPYVVHSSVPATAVARHVRG